MKKYMIFTIEIIILVFLVPFIVSKIPILSGRLIDDTVSLIINMLFITIFALFFGRKYRFSWLLPIITGVIFLFYAYLNKFAIAKRVFYAILCMIATIVGNLMGLMFGKKEK